MSGLSTHGHVSDEPDSGGEDGGGSVLDISQSPAGRWSAVIAQLEITSGDLFIVFESGINRFMIYDSTRDDPEKFSGFFREKSSVVYTDDTHATVSLLPNGGWWTRDFSLKYIAGTELL